VLSALLGRLAAGEDLSMAEMTEAVDGIMQGSVGEGEIGLLLTGLRLKGETVAEIAGAAAAMRKYMIRIRHSRTGAIDTCGTGGDGSGTFNISTAAALVTAAAGVPVAKHGNRRMTSRSGSADVLAELGVNIDASVERVGQCLDELGICFCFAPLLHPSMKRVADVRRKLGFPTIFNLLGPLTNPARAPFQLLGVGRPELRPLMAEALALLGAQRAAVVCGEDGLDEVTLGGRTLVSELSHGPRRDYHWMPEDFGLAPAARDALLVDGPPASAAIIRRVLAGEPGPPRDIVVINSAAALWIAGKAETPPACARLAEAALDSGAASELLARLAEMTAPRAA
jgi:anthranilate phosphoribosyltransferase